MREYIAVVLVGAVALAGPVLGFWKIDTMGLASILAGVFVLFSPMLLAIHWKAVGVALVVLGAILWTDAGVAL